MIKLNLKKFAISFFNIVVSVALFFKIRRLILGLFGMSVGRGTTIHRRVKFFDFGKFKIGDCSTINPDCFIDNRGEVLIGNNVNISHCVKIYTMTHDVNKYANPIKSSFVIIGDNVWIYPYCLIMPGVVIGEGAVIYPGSVVTKDVDSFSIVGGIPAKHIKHRIQNSPSDSSYSVWMGY